MGQVTSRLTDEQEAALNRWANEEGTQRSDLIRRILIEAIEARRENRAMFVQPELPGPAELAHLAREHRELASEFDRVTRSNAKREAVLLTALSLFEADTAAARERGGREVSKQLREAIAPFEKALARMRGDWVAALGEQPRLDTMDATLVAHGKAISDYTAAVRELAAQPRITNVYQIGSGEWSGRKLAGVGSGAVAVGAVMFVCLAWLLPNPWLAAPVSNVMLGGGDRASCSIIEYQYRTKRCHAFRNDDGDVRIGIEAPSADASSGTRGGKR